MSLAGSDAACAAEPAGAMVVGSALATDEAADGPQLA
jgi:hypothetical protein